MFETGTIRARPQVQAGLAIGKFVKEPFDEEARTNMFGQAEGISGAEVTAPNVIARSDLSAVARRAKAEATKQSSLLR